MRIKNELRIVLNDFKQNWPVAYLADREAYGHWLAQTYFFVSHSVPLLGFALPHLRDVDLKRHFEHHIGEEERHELLALKDLEKLGKRIADYQESPFTQAFYQSQYYRIQFEGATSFLGYIVFLEAMAVEWATGLYELMKDDCPQSVLFLKVHVEEDVSHVDRALNLIATLSNEEQEKIIRNMRYSAQIYAQIVESATKLKGKLKVA